jgi:hypothetical protein
MALRKIQASLLADGSVNGSTITDGSIAAVDLSASAITDKLGYTPAPANNPTLTGTITLAGSTQEIVFDRTLGDNWIGSSVVIENGNISVFEPPTNFYNWLRSLEAGDTFTIQPGGQELTVSSTTDGYTFLITTEEVIDETPGEGLLTSFWITSFTQTIIGAPNVILGATTLEDTLATKITRTSSTGSALIPTGTTAERDSTPESGLFRFNSDTDSFEGYNGSAWGAVGGGATGGAGNAVFYENDQTISVNYTITEGKNAMTAGPVTLADGVEVTIPDGTTWTIV